MGAGAAPTGLLHQDPALPALGAVRVLDAGRGLAAAAAARLLHACGAQVHWVDTPGHEVFDDAYPAIRSWRESQSAVRPDQVAALLPHIDVLIVGGEDHPEAGEGLQVDPPADQPALVVLEIDGYVPGTAEPTPAVDLLVQARTGMAAEQFSDRPVHIAFAPADYGAAITGVIGVLAALLGRAQTGRGRRVRATFQQGLALFWPHHWIRADRTDAAFDTVPPRDVRHLIFRCADGGFVQLVLGVPAALAKVYGALGIDGPVDPGDRGAPVADRGPDDYFAERGVLARAIARMSRADVLAALRRVGIAAEPVLAPGACFDDEQVRAAELVEVDSAGREFAAPPIRLRPVPVPGPGHPPRPRTGEAPLSGVRVLDLGNWVAGPFASKLLADLGADVVSVEPPVGLSHLTGLRNVLTSNRGKRSLALDLRTPEGREVVRALAADADVVHHNFRPGVAERLGVDAAALREVRPDLVHLHTSAYGRTGPRAGHGGFDMVIQALCGHEVRAGGSGGEPLWYRSPFVDYGTGGLGAVALLAGLYERAVTGVGVDVDVSLLAAGLFLRGELVREPGGRVRGATVLDAGQTGFRPAESLYRTTDGWIAVAARGRRMTTALAELAGIGDAPPGDWGTEERVAIARVLGRHDTAAALGLLDRAGVWATRCRTDAFAEFTGDPAAWASHLVIETPDALYGRVYGCFGPLVGLSGWTPGSAGFRPAPLPGEHTIELLDQAGLPAERSADLLRRGIARAAPPPAPIRLLRTPEVTTTRTAP